MATSNPIPPIQIRGGDALTVARAVVDVLSGAKPGSAALATVIGSTGSTPQVVGARLLLHENGEMVGTVGGGSIEYQVLEACRKCLQNQTAQRVQAHLVRDLGMCCGGSMEVFVEYLQAENRLILIGGGHVAQALAPIAYGVGLRVFVVDDRTDLFTLDAFHQATCLDYDVEELAQANLNLTSQDYVLIVSRDHRRDEQALAYFLTQPHRYLGMIGSKRKVYTILTRILRKEHEMDRPPPDLSRLHAPVGLALAGRTPAEIAISIVAEIIAHRREGHGGSMNIVPKAAVQIRAELGKDNGET